MRRMIPWRRWVGRIVTLVSAALGTMAPPGTVISEANDRSVPTIDDPSNAAHARDRSWCGRLASAWPGRGSIRKPRIIASVQASCSSVVMVRTSTPMRG